MNAPEIEEAIARVKEGNLDDYRTVVAAYHSRLRAVLAGLCPPGVDPDEIAQLSFIEAYRNLGRYRPESDFFAWLSTIARYRLLAESTRRHRQWRHRHNYVQQLLAEGLDRLAQGESEWADRRFGWLHECVGQLTPQAQSLLEGRYRDGEALEALAALLGRSAAAVRVQLFAIRKKLRECIERKARAYGVAND